MVQDFKIRRMLYNQKQFNDALETLSIAIYEPNYNEYVRDSIIQRFEYTYETAWKLIKSVLSYQGIELRHPKEIFAEAFSSGWIQNPDHWDDMIEDRNLTTHTYRERTAEMVSKAVKDIYFSDLQHLLTSMNGVIHHHVRPSGENKK